MNYNNLSNLICGGETPGFLGLFDFSTAPSFLFYSYIPIAVLSLIIGLFIFRSDKKSLQSKLLLSVVLFFVGWVLNIIVQWVSSYHSVLMFAWQLTAILEVGIFLSTVYFSYVFLNKKDLPFLGKFILWLIFFTVVCLTPTHLNITAYDINNCEGSIGQMWDFIYVLETIAITAIVFVGFDAIRNKNYLINKRQNTIFTSGVVFFLSTFFLSNFYGEITKIYEFNLWGPLGMFVFFILLTYMIVRFHVFNVKLIATQALIATMWVLILGILFLHTIENVRIVTLITLVLVGISGDILIKSVRREIQQKEELVKLNKDLENLLKQRESLVHLVTHKVKGSFTRSKYIFATILDGTFGEISNEIRKISQQGMESDNIGIETVDLVLNVSNMQKGTVKYDMKQLNLKEVVDKVIAEKKIYIEERGLKLDNQIKDGVYNINGDVFWLKEAINNLVDNAIKYTRAGVVTVNLENKEGKIVLSVRDTGVGITDEDKPLLFTEGGRGKNSLKVNIDSTGYGLYSVKLIADAHKGRVWAESEGADKGSTFYMELAAV